MFYTNDSLGLSYDNFKTNFFFLIKTSTTWVKTGRFFKWKYKDTILRFYFSIWYIRFFRVQ